MSQRESELNPVSGSLSIIDRIISRMPEHIRDAARLEMEREASLSPEQREEEQQTLEANRQKQQVVNRRRNAREQCGLSGKQWSNTIDSYKLLGSIADKQSQQSAKDVVSNFAQQFPKVERGLMFWGEPGRGKDGMLHSLVQLILAKPRIYSVRYAYSLDIERDMRNEWQYHNDPDTAVEERLRRSNLVCIGDLNKLLTLESKGVTTENVVNATIRILNQSASTGKPVICATSNFGPSEWKARFPEFLDSRMAEIFDWYEITGPDRRRLRSDNTPGFAKGI